MNLRNLNTYLILDAFTSPLFSAAMFLTFISAGLMDHVATNTIQLWPVPAVFFLLILSSIWNTLSKKISPGFTQYKIDNLIKITVSRVPQLLLFYWFLPMEGNIIGFIYIPVTAILLFYAGITHLFFFLIYREQQKIKVLNNPPKVLS